MSNRRQKPEWVPEGPCDGFASSVMDGVEGGHDGLPRMAASPPAGSGSSPRRRSALSIDDYVQGVLKGDRTVLARAITLVESNAPAHLDQAQEVLGRLLSHAGRSIRLGVTGMPGSGKSTFIEALGTFLCERGKRVAVLAVDPSSSLTRGSILGDKTRMERLSRRPQAFIRPSPSGGMLGGVARKSRETMLLCEAAGHDVVIVETVGVGQSESTVRSMVDFFLLVMIPGAGDELQGIKRGIMELTDAVLVNKADGENKVKAQAARSEFEQVLPYLQPATPGWTTRALACSSLTGEGIDDVWAVIEQFREETGASGEFERRRSRQAVEWIHMLVREYLRTSFFSDPSVKELLPEVEAAVTRGELSPTRAVQSLIRQFERER